eukprot:XP_001706435.1 Hypothetical protein GL50803_37945 [Giardia lamblia ATCC 50803]
MCAYLSIAQRTQRGPCQRPMRPVCDYMKSCLLWVQLQHVHTMRRSRCIFPPILPSMR